ncbi:Ig-like domain-containing protein [Actinokineospora globicatena]|uniref:Ig-like domain-containing protein n=1 Tax=Actinokineospora globicatena TaxID=103729 RepID=UPI0035573C03
MARRGRLHRRGDRARDRPAHQGSATRPHRNRCGAVPAVHGICSDHHSAEPHDHDLHRTATDPATALTATATLTVEVSNALPDAITMPAGGTVTGLDVLANDLCPGCTITSVTTASYGTSVSEGSAVGWTPPADFAGLASFGYTAGDGSQVVSSTVRILVTPPPLAVSTPVDQDLAIQPPVRARVASCSSARLQTTATWTKTEPGSATHPDLATPGPTALPTA